MTSHLMSLGARRGVPEGASQATPCRKLAAALVSMGGDLSQAMCKLRHFVVIHHDVVKALFLQTAGLSRSYLSLW
jgi:hypothetical protein